MKRAPIDLTPAPRGDRAELWCVHVFGPDLRVRELPAVPMRRRIDA